MNYYIVLIKFFFDKIGKLKIFILSIWRERERDVKICFGSNIVDVILGKVVYFILVDIIIRFFYFDVNDLDFLYFY